MAASVITKVFLPLRLTCSTRATSAPACATRKRPGSSSRRPSKPPQRALDGRGVLLHLGGGASKTAAVVVDAQPTAGIDGLERNAVAPELPHQLADALHGRAERLRRTNLRADVNADAVGLKPAVAGHALVNPQRLADVDAEFVLAQAGGDVGMRLGKNIGIDAQGEARLAS